MATKNLTRLNVSLNLSTGSFGKAIGGAVNDAKAFGMGLQRAIMGPLGLITGALSTGAFIAGIKSAAERIDNLAKSADRLGIATQSLAGMRLATEEAGGSVEGLESGMARLQKTVQDAADGNKAATKTITDLGLSVNQLVGMRADAQFAVVADAINNLDTQGKKTAATLEVFGRGSMALSNTLALGSAGLQQATKDAEAMGIAISRVDAFKVEEANDAFGRIGKVVEGVFNKITVRLAPFITGIAEAFTNASINANGFGSTIDKVFSFAIDSVAFVIDAWQGLGIIWQALQVGVAKIGLAVVQFGDNAAQVADWVGTKFSQAWDLTAANANLLWNALKVGWAALKVPVAEFVQYAGSKLAELVAVAARAAMQFDAEVGAAMIGASMSIQQAVGTMGVDARADLQKSVDGIKQAGGESADAMRALFSPVQTESSLLMKILREDFQGLIDEQQTKLNDLRSQGRTSDSFRAGVGNFEAEAQARAEKNAMDLAAKQSQMDAVAAVESDGLDALRPQWMEYYDWQKNTQAQNLSHSLSASSSFFANLSKLQDSHSKTAQRVGKIAAKGKIVTDTASAAMGAYSAMASIPFVGPALGAAAAAAAVLAGGIQLANVDKGAIGGGGASGPADVSTTNIGGVQAPAQTGQTIIVQGEGGLSVETLDRILKEGQERGFFVEGVRRG